MKEQTESNKVIAEFMELPTGFQDVQIWAPNQSIPKREKRDYFLERELQYHTSFDWLMPVVEKIYLLGYWVTITPYQTGINCPKSKKPHFSGLFDKHVDNMLLNTHDAVLAFITWYNTQQK